MRKTKLINPREETEPRIQIQILRNLLEHVEDEDPKCGFNAWAMGDAQRKIHKIQRLARFYVKKNERKKEEVRDENVGSGMNIG